MEQKLNNGASTANATPKKTDWLTAHMNARFGEGTRVARGYDQIRPKRKRIPQAIQDQNKSNGESRKERKDRRDRRNRNQARQISQTSQPVRKSPRQFITEQPKVDLATFVWPQFKNDRERIKFYTQLFKNREVTSAFEEIYKIQCNHSEVANITPVELAVGAEMTCRILEISKNHVTFDIPNAKIAVTSAVNLYKFEFFKHFIPKDPIRVRVVRIERDKVVVDPIAPMLDEWLAEINNNPNSQKIIGAPVVVKVKNLRGVRGGFVGQAVIPTVSKYVGEDYTVDAFIPNSQMVLNLVEDDMSAFEGATVETFALSYSERKSRFGQLQKSLVCSIRELLQFKGDCRIIDFFKGYCENSADWQKFRSTTLPGMVTGVINSNKKCGVFVEIPELYITGMIEMPAEELVNYAPRDEVQVRLTGFDEELVYNDGTDQMQHVEPYTINEDGTLENVTIKPVLELM